jgi:hypothetical protein
MPSRSISPAESVVRAIELIGKRFAFSFSERFFT